MVLQKPGRRGSTGSVFVLPRHQWAGSCSVGIWGRSLQIIISFSSLSLIVWWTLLLSTELPLQLLILLCKEFSKCRCWFCMLKNRTMPHMLVKRVCVCMCVRFAAKWHRMTCQTYILLFIIFIILFSFPLEVGCGHCHILILRKLREGERIAFINGVCILHILKLIMWWSLTCLTATSISLSKTSSLLVFISNHGSMAEAASSENASRSLSFWQIKQIVSHI